MKGQGIKVFATGMDTSNSNSIRTIREDDIGTTYLFAAAGERGDFDGFLEPFSTKKTKNEHEGALVE